MIDFKEIDRMLIEKDIEGMIPYMTSITGKYYKQIGYNLKGLNWDDLYGKVLDITMGLMEAQDWKTAVPSVQWHNNIRWAMKPGNYWTDWHLYVCKNHSSLEELLENPETKYVESRWTHKQEDLMTKIMRIEEWTPMERWIIETLIDSLDFWDKNAADDFGRSVKGNFKKIAASSQDPGAKEWLKMDKYRRGVEIKKVMNKLGEHRDEWAD